MACSIGPEAIPILAGRQTRDHLPVLQATPDAGIQVYR